MKIDGTMFGMYAKCGLLYYERYEAPQSDVQGRENRNGLVQIQGLGEGSAVSPLLVGLAGAPATDAKGIELDEPSPGRDFGSRMHQLLHERRCQRLGISIHAGAGPVAGLGTQAGAKAERYPEWPDEDIESECQATLAAYEAHYIRDYEYLESERTHTIPFERVCPDCGGPGGQKLSLPEDQRICQDCGEQFTIHSIVVKLDAVVRHLDGTIGPFDTKTESKPGYNSREDWANRPQAKIYLWALGALYPNERVSRFVLDVVSRGSPKARRGPLFYRHDDLNFSPEAIQEQLRNLMYVADNIELNRRTGWWPSNTNLCKRGWEKCDYFVLHVLGRTSENLKKYRPAEQYLDT